jgi:hypothetical protein
MQVGHLRPGIEKEAFTGIRYDWLSEVVTWLKEQDVVE